MRTPRRHANAGNRLILAAALALAVGCGDGEPAPGAEPGDGGASEQGTTIVRDSRGVPHIYAPSLEDAFFALGRAQAEDRLFQMHYRRTVMQGRLAEYFAVSGTGSEASTFNSELILSDRRTRTIGYSRRAELAMERLDTEHRELLDAYADGVNAYLEELEGELPVAFEIAGIDAIDPWLPRDSILAWDWVGWHFDQVIGRMDQELGFLADCESPNGCDRVPCDFPIDEDAAVVPPPLGGVWPPNQQASLQAGGVPRLNVQVKASHGWVVHGSRTTTGKPTLDGEPQLALEAPSTWHEFHIDAGGINVRGVGIAGAPGVYVFRNQHIAQTATAGGADVVDLFELDRPEGSAGYVVDGSERAFDERVETIAVKGREAIEITVRETALGPVIDDIVDAPSGRSFAMGLASHLPERPPSVIAGIELMRADSLASYRDAIRLWRTPTLNLLYAGVDADAPADSQGHIAYHTGTAIPRRAEIEIDGRDFTGRYPYDGSDSSQHWGPLYDIDWHPHVIDPASGYLFSGNHIPVGSWYDELLYSGIAGIGDSFRSLRVRYALAELLPEAGSTASPTDIHGLHFDARSEIVRGLHDMYGHLAAEDLIKDAGDLEEMPTTRKEKAARVLIALDAWRERGGELSYRDLAWPLVSRLTANAQTKARWQQNLEFACRFNGSEAGASFAVKTFDEEGGEMMGPEVVTWLLDVAEAAWDESVAVQGESDPGAWTLPEAEPQVVRYQKNFACLRPGAGKTCSLDPRHESAVVLDDAFVHTINAAFGSSYPLSVDFSAADAARGFLPPGVSEDPGSPHFDDSLAFTVLKAAKDPGGMPHSTIDRETVMGDAQSVVEVTR